MPELESTPEPEHLFRLLVENMLEGVVIVDWDTTILFANNVAATLLGFDSVEEFIGHKSLEFVHPDSKDSLLENLNAIKRGEIRPNNEYRFTTNKGENVWFETSGTKIEFEGRSADLVTFNDITERKKAEEALRKSEEEFRLAFENAKDAIFWADPETGIIIRCNKAAETLMEKKKEEIVGHHQTEIHPPEEAEYYAHVFKNHANRKEVDAIDAEVITKSQKRIPVNISASIMTVGGKPIIQRIFRDITDRKKAENKIKASLKEKEVLLKEIHHRVKNNMQVISSLLSLQSSYITDQILLDMFKDTQNRIRSMALVHEKLYQSKDFANIDFKEYIKVLAAHVFQSYSVDSEDIALTIDAEKCFLEIDTAVPCGLIINELVSNAVKHAFPDGKGEITIKFHAYGENVQLVVSDNGVGILEEIDIRNTESLGLQLVTILAEEQLDGTIRMNREKGTEFCITFKRVT